MKTATVRELRNQFARLSRWIEDGESVEITKDGRPFARLTPPPEESTRKVKMPDFVGRLKKLYPDEKPSPAVGTQSIVDYDRGDR